MRLSLNWLKELVDLTVSAAEVAERLTMAGLEVEALEEVTPDFSGVVVARVMGVEPHPNADRLQIAAVDDGGHTYAVVCGAPNVRAGRLYPFAPPGAVLAGGRRLEPAKLRGVVSQGMLMAEDELGLSPDHEGLMELPQDLTVGQDLVAALNLQDTVLTVAITANRSDCLSVLGLAREVAALLNQPLRHPEVQAASSRGPELKAKVTILAPVHCPRYAARLLTGLTVQASPFWLRRRLQLAGLRSINSLVDVTNYVLLEFGQPLHAFDFEKLGGGEIVVRLPRPGERTFVTLDGQERQLDPETLLICDAARPVALAGIMGGLDSEVTAATSQVLIESAYFNPRTIRRTAKRLGLSTEASYRFERGVDPDAVTHALERATQLMLAVGGGEACGARLDAYPAPIYHPRLSLRVSRANQVLGTDFSQEKMVELLRRLHLPVVSVGPESLVVQVPSFRGDLEREVDLIEEIARLAGYGTIPVTLPRGVVSTPRPGPEVELRTAAKQLLLGLGFFEAITYSFQPERLEALMPEAAPALPVLRLANPLSEEQAVMRTSLLPGLLETLRRNTLKQVLDVRLFEVAKVFIPEPGADLPREEHWLAGAMYGGREEAAWNSSREAVDFFDLKGAVETLLEGLQIPEVNFRADGLPLFLGYGARAYSGDVELGVLGGLLPEVSEQLDLEGRIFVFNLDFEALVRTSAPPRFSPLPRYPAAYRDIALVVPEEVPAARVAQALYHHGRPWLVEARLFDVYTGEPIPPGKRSLAYRLSYRDPERTLTDDLVNPHHQALVAALTRELGAELR
ncbi:MAG: phenylalanine--tRNA ligase subunit beta [Pseudomonadota bacterium]